jgi:hypothetical protein
VPVVVPDAGMVAPFVGAMVPFPRTAPPETPVVLFTPWPRPFTFERFRPLVPVVPAAVPVVPVVVPLAPTFTPLVVPVLVVVVSRVPPLLVPLTALDETPPPPLRLELPRALGRFVMASVSEVRTPLPVVLRPDVPEVGPGVLPLDWADAVAARKVAKAAPAKNREGKLRVIPRDIDAPCRSAFERMERIRRARNTTAG